MDCIEAIEAGIAPKMEAGLAKLKNRIADGKWYSKRTLEVAITSTGLKISTARNVISGAEKHGILKSRKVKGTAKAVKRADGKGFTSVMKTEYKLT